ncbi:putative protein-serine/threonine phosphatase [Helianthus anomalus]
MLHLFVFIHFNLSVVAMLIKYNMEMFLNDFNFYTSLAVILAFVALKVRYPQRITILIGNDESRQLHFIAMNPYYGWLIMHYVVTLIAERQKGTCTNRPLSRLLSVRCLVSKA